MLEVRALAKATEVLRQAQDIRAGKPSAIIVLSMVGKNYRLTQDMKDAAKALDLPLASRAMILRQIYADAPGQGAVVWNLGSRARDAAEEVRHLFREILPDARRGKAGKKPSQNRSRLKEEIMAERRALIEGLKPKEPPVDPAKEKEFVFGAKETTPEPAEPNVEATALAPNFNGRVPLSTRMRSDFATALKRASLERQLSRVEPNTLTEILEQAVEPWLRRNGYLN